MNGIWFLSGYQIKSPVKNIEGKINIPNLSEENDISEIDVSIFN